MIVADTNLVAYFVIPTVATKAAEAVRARDGAWVAPSLFRHELLNVTAQHVRRGTFGRDAGARAFRRGLSIVDLDAQQADAIAVLNMVGATGCSSYDVEFVWLAMELGLRLVTADKEVVRAFPDVAVSIEDFAAGK